MNTNDKIQEVEIEIVEAKQQVEAVIINILERGEKLEDLGEKAIILVDTSNLFSKKAYKVKKKMCCKKYKAKLILLFMVLLGLTFIAFILYYIIYMN
jgi:hypothetical protein